MKAIQTRYLPATAKLPARLKVWAEQVVLAGPTSNIPHNKIISRGVTLSLQSLIAAWGQDALYAAQQEADIADQFEGTGEPFFDELSRSHRAISLALLAYHITSRSH